MSWGDSKATNRRAAGLGNQASKVSWALFWVFIFRPVGRRQEELDWLMGHFNSEASEKWGSCIAARAAPPGPDLIKIRLYM